MTEVTNQQNNVPIDAKNLEAFLIDALSHSATHGSASVAIVSDSRMKILNSRFRGKDTTTDVLSFPHVADEFDENPDFLGDIIISADQAKRQAAENGLPLELELKQLILHGILHLLGHDHETDQGQMNQLELNLRIQLDIE